MVQANQVIDPMALKDMLWPDVTFYKEQKQIIYSVWNDDETVVPAGNKLGKDFVAGFIILAFFISRYPCKIVTTSVKEKHLDILWGEVSKFLRISKYPLILGEEKIVNGSMVVGDTLTVSNDGLRRVLNGVVRRDSYAIKLVANDQSLESFQGHHVTPDPGQPIDDIPRNMFVADEASGIKDAYYKMVRPWARRKLIFGNPWPCANFFYKAVKGDHVNDIPGGDIARDNGNGYHRKVIKIKAEDSPNVKLGLGQETRDITPTNQIIIPGVRSHQEYLLDRKMWDKIQQCVSLDAEFYEGEEVKLFPPDKMDAASVFSSGLVRQYGKKRRGVAIGCDPGEGSANTSWTIGDPKGFIAQINKKTIDTTIVTEETVRLMREYGVAAENVLFDRGGGGKEHADRLRKDGYNVRTIGFGEAVTAEKTRGLTTLADRKLQDEERYTYVSRRCEMYHLLSMAINPSKGDPFGIPREMGELRRQLNFFPKVYDKEGRIWLPPKNKPPGSKDSSIITLTEMIGRSPDEADSAVMCYYAMAKPSRRSKAGSVIR